MKNLKLAIIVIAALTMSMSCSNKPNTDDLKKLITNYEKEHSTKDKNYIVLPCGFSKAIEIPKVFKYVTIAEEKSLTELSEKQKKVFEAISLNGIITMTKTRDESDILQDLGLRVRQEYNINLTTQGETLKIGETGDAYLLNMFDVNDVKILKEDFHGSDTLLVTYQLSKTPLYKAINDVCENSSDNFLVKGDSLFVRLTYSDKQWKINK